MATIYKPPGRKKYIIEYLDEDGFRHRKTGTSDKSVTERIAAKLENEVALRREGIVDPRDEAYRDNDRRPLREHLADWHKYMIDRGKTAKHADQYRDRAAKLVAMVNGASFKELVPGRKAEAMTQAAELLNNVTSKAYFPDLTAEGIQGSLADLASSGKSSQTVNHHRAALRAFLLWCRKTKRIRETPMTGVDPLNQQDPERTRRALTNDELAQLIRASSAGPIRFEMTGPVRSMAYRVAAGTGFRVEELRSLTPESFRLDGIRPSIFLKASSTKNRKPADQPISQDLADELREWLQDQPRGQSVFPLHHETAKAIKADLESCGITYATDDGVADFHSLRSYYVSALVRSGCSIKEVQILARHAKPETTLKHYAKVSSHDLYGAVESLPSLYDRPRVITATSTGTTHSESASITTPTVGMEKSQTTARKQVASDCKRFAKPAQS